MNLHNRLLEGKKATDLGFDPKEDPYRSRRDRGVIREPEEAFKLHNQKHPENPIKPGSKQLGKGSYGQVFPSKSGVVKIDQSAREARLLKTLPDRLKKHSVIPQNVKVGSMRLPPSWKATKRAPDFDDEDGNPRKQVKTHSRRAKLTTISREDVKDIPSGKMADHLDDLENHINNSLHTTKEASTPYQRTHLKLTLHNWHKHVQSDPELETEHKKSLRKYAGGMARLIHHGIVPQDLYAHKNVGMRPDGSIVMRDLGIYKVLDDHKDKKNPVSPIAKNVSKFKALRSKGK